MLWEAIPTWVGTMAGKATTQPTPATSTLVVCRAATTDKGKQGSPYTASGETINYKTIRIVFKGRY